MARRSDHSRDELYDIALNAAKTIIEKDGLDALTARNVADAIGYSPGTLYNLFDNLNGLILRLNSRTLDSLYAALNAIPRQNNPEKDIRALLDGYLGFLETSPHLWRALFEHTLPAGESLPEWYTLKIDRLMALIASTLSPIFKNPDGTEADRAARILWASLHGICSLSDTGKLDVVTTQTVGEMAESLVTHFVAGLKIKGTEPRGTSS